MTELILAILFFALGSAICVQAFVKARLMSREAENLSFASAQVSSAASVARYTGGSYDSASKWFPDAEGDGGTFYVYYDSDRQPCRASDAVYTMEVVSSESDGAGSSHIAMTDRDGSVLYELDIRYPMAGADGSTAADAGAGNGYSQESGEEVTQ